MADRLVVPRRCRGPAASGNGGWTAGALASRLAVPPGTGVQVRLTAPPPLDVPMDVVPVAVPGGDGLELRSGDLVVATAVPAPAPRTPVPSSGWDEAVAAGPAYRGRVGHPFPECYACGTGRSADEEPGLGLAPGPVAPGRTAAAWTAPADVDGPVVWAALDCPGGWTVDLPGRPMVLGTMTASVVRLPEPGERCVVDGVLVGERGRRVLTATALRSWDGGAAGEELARADAVWVRLR